MKHSATISAIVVSRNEAHLLEGCLTHLQWCDQLIVVDLASSDETRAVAQRYADLVLSHAFSPIVEPVRCFAAEHATGDWLLFVDPDEQIPESLVGAIRSATASPGDAGVIRLPWRFYFKSRPLQGTVWGGTGRTKRFVAHRDRVELLPWSQSGIRLHEGFSEFTITAGDDNHVRHAWVASYRQLLEKHIRLACHEGEPRYEKGVRFRWRDLLMEPMRAGRYCLITREGWREGPRGFILSAVYALYVGLACIALARYQFGRTSGRPAADSVQSADNSQPCRTRPPQRKAA